MAATGELIRLINYIDDINTTLRRIHASLYGIDADERKKLAENLRGAATKLNELVEQVEDLFPRVKQVLADSEFGMDAVKRVEKTVTTARKALGAKRVATVNHSIEQLSRTLQLFKSLQQRAGIEVE